MLQCLGRIYQCDIKIKGLSSVVKAKSKEYSAIGIAGIYEPQDEISGAVCDWFYSLGAFTLWYLTTGKFTAAAGRQKMSMLIYILNCM